MTRSLLPNGLRDILPHDAVHEASMLDGLLSTFRQNGYERVEPPLVEFEDNLLQGPGSAMEAHMFRVMDPVSQRMMGVRADITPQVARVASTRLASEPRPLRLSYGGPVLRVKGTQLRPERQYTQTGAELIGVDIPEADAEVMILAVKALANVGVENVTVDITLPTVIREVLEAGAFEAAQCEDVLTAVDRRDVDAIAASVGEKGQLLCDLITASGPCDQAMTSLKALDLPEAAKNEIDRLETVLALLKSALPDVMVTIDPVERRGFEYQTGISFTVFARGVRGEMGRGGRYLLAGDGEPATGFSLYLDSVLRAVGKPAPIDRVFVPAGTETAILNDLHAEGWVTISGLVPVQDAMAEAKRLGCSHIVSDGSTVSVE